MRIKHFALFLAQGECSTDVILIILLSLKVLLSNSYLPVRQEGIFIHSYVKSGTLNSLMKMSNSTAKETNCYMNLEMVIGVSFWVIALVFCLVFGLFPKGRCRR